MTDSSFAAKNRYAIRWIITDFSLNYYAIFILYNGQLRHFLKQPSFFKSLNKLSQKSFTEWKLFVEQLAKSADPDQTAPEEQSGLGLHF